MKAMRGRALRTAAMLSVALIATALSGCASSPTPPTPAPSPSPTASPLFASEEEALAAATEAYAAYQAVADEVAEAGGAGADKYEQVATGDALAKGRESAEEYQKAGAYAVGSTVVEFVDMQQAQLQAADSELLFYVCL
ncbi:MAG: hypothetical protein JWR33_1674, partial [Naasia sp.]|nr:hypothetical protein [Naasia sp.]